MTGFPLPKKILRMSINFGVAARKIIAHVSVPITATNGRHCGLVSIRRAQCFRIKLKQSRQLKNWINP